MSQGGALVRAGDRPADAAAPTDLTQPPEVRAPARLAEPGRTAPGLRPHTAQALAGAANGTADHVAVVLLVDLAKASRLWGWSRIVRGAAPLREVPGLCFAKVMGSGQGGGFGLRPSATHQAVFMLFDGEAAATHFVDSAPRLLAYRQRARECCVLTLRAWSCRGQWSGQSVAVTTAAPEQGPVVALTRASIRPWRAATFWSMAPAAQADLARAPGCRLAAGLGEAPLLRQATLSLWDSVAAMDAYARSGAHLQAIRAAHAGNFFSESMFVRFKPLHIQGRWQGHDHG